MTGQSERGKFIVFEGGEGAGKSTQIETAKTFLINNGIEVVQTREPGGTEIGEHIRNLLLDKSLPAMHSDTELLLMFAARAEHLQRKIIPALQRGAWVLSDRFTDASYAYQGFGRGIALDRLSVLESWVQQSLHPDLVIILDIDVEVGLQRVASRGEADRFEEEQVAFFERVRNGYLARAAQDTNRYLLINAEQPITRVSEELVEHLESILDQWQQP